VTVNTRISATPIQGMVGSAAGHPEKNIPKGTLVKTLYVTSGPSFREQAKGYPYLPKTLIAAISGPQNF